MILLGLYGTALVTSMAAMELFSWLLVALALVAWVQVASRTGGRALWAKLRLGPGSLGPDLWIGLFLLIHVVSLLLSPVSIDRGSRLGDFRWILILYALTWIWRQLNWEQILKIYRWIFGVVVVAGLYSFVQFLTGIQLFRSRQTVWPMGDFYRATGFFNSSLTFAYVCGQLGLVGAGRLWTTAVNKWFSRENAIWLAAATAGALGCLSSMTRGSWVALMATAVIVLVMARPRRLIGLMIGFALILGIGLGTSASLRERFTSIVDPKNRSNEHRFIIWEAQWQVYKNHPWLGVGLGQNRRLTIEAFDRGRGYDQVTSEAFFTSKGIPRSEIATHAHNNYFHMLVGGGPLGLLSYLLMIGWFLRESWRIYARFASSNPALAFMALGIFGAQVFFHVGGLTECNFTDAEVNHTLIFLWSTLAALRLAPAQDRISA